MINEEETMSTKLRIIYIFIFSCLLSGCSFNKSESLPDCGIQDDRINTYLEINYNDLNTYELGDPITIIIVQKEDVDYYAASDYDIRLFIYNDETLLWKEIENRPASSEQTERVYSKGEVGFTAFLPRAGFIDKNAKLYFCIYGYLVENGEPTNKVIGASDVIYLYPQR